MAVAIDPKTGKPLNVPMPQQPAQQKDFLGRPMKPFTNTPLTGNDANALDRTPMPDYMQTMQSDAVKSNGGNPLPSGNQSVAGWANLPSWGGGQTNAPTYQPPTGQGASGGSPSSNVIPNSNLQATANLRNKQLLAGGENAWKTGLAGAKNSFDYTNQITQGNRALEDFDNSQRGDIYGGSAREDKFRLQRARGINDTFTNNDYNNKTGSINQTWADLQAAAPEQMQAIYDQLLRQEREYGLQEGALTGNFQGGRTLAGSAQDFNQGMQNKQFDQNQQSQDAQFTGQYNGQQTQQAQNQQFNQNMDTQKFDYGVGRDVIGDTRYKDETTYSRGQQAWQNAFAKEQYSDEKATKLWEQNFKSANFQQDMKDAAASRGLQWAGLNQRDKEFIADQTYREKSFNADQAQRVIDNTYKANTGDNAPKTAEDYFSSIDKSPLVQKEMSADNGQPTGRIVPTDKGALGDYIFNLGLSESETRKAYLRYGLKWGE